MASFKTPYCPFSFCYFGMMLLHRYKCNDVMGTTSLSLGVPDPAQRTAGVVPASQAAPGRLGRQYYDTIVRCTVRTDLKPQPPRLGLTRFELRKPGLPGRNVSRVGTHLCQ